MAQNTLNEKVKLSNPQKMLWPNLDITKLEYVKIMHGLAPYILKYTKDKYLTCIRYPDGIYGKSFYQKNKPSHAPDWIPTLQYGGNDYVNLINEDILMWLCNLAVIEFHISFERADSNKPDFLIFDLDPSQGVPFEMVRESAIVIYETLKGFSISCMAKTSGATGIQILIPHGRKLNYDEGRKFNEFFSRYFSEKYPHLFSIERIVKKRGNKIYFDYLQMWQGKSLIAPYSPRAVEHGAVSMPLKWGEVYQGVTPKDFNLQNILSILKKRGDLLAEYVLEENIPLQNFFNEIKNLQH